MYTSDQIAAALVAWGEARQKIRGLQPVDYTTNYEAWQAHHTAIDEVEALTAVLYQLAEDLEQDAETMRGLLDAIEQQAQRETDAYSARYPDSTADLPE